MKTKKLVSLLLTIGMLLSVTLMIGITASAETQATTVIKEQPSYENRYTVTLTDEFIEEHKNDTITYEWHAAPINAGQPEHGSVSNDGKYIYTSNDRYNDVLYSDVDYLMISNSEFEKLNENFIYVKKVSGDLSKLYDDNFYEITFDKDGYAELSRAGIYNSSTESYNLCYTSDELQPVEFSIQFYLSKDPKSGTLYSDDWKPNRLYTDQQLLGEYYCDIKVNGTIVATSENVDVRTIKFTLDGTDCENIFLYGSDEALESIAYDASTCYILNEYIICNLGTKTFYCHISAQEDLYVSSGIPIFVSNYDLTDKAYYKGADNEQLLMGTCLSNDSFHSTDFEVGFNRIPNNTADSTSLTDERDAKNIQISANIDEYSSTQSGTKYYSVTNNTTFGNSLTNNGYITLDYLSASKDTVITVTDSPLPGYELDTVYVNDSAIEGTTFKMPEEDVTVSATFKVKTKHTVTTDICTNGSVSVDKSSIYSGDTVTVTATPAEGYVLDTVTIKKTSDSSDITETVSYDAAKGTFTMPDYDVTVSATFKVAPVCYIDADNSNSFTNGDTEYASIAAALAAAKPATESKDKPTVIRMIADSDENITVTSDRFITLDLDGYVLKGTGSGSVITNNGQLTIEDSNSDSRKAYFTYNSDTAWTYIAEPTAAQTTGAVAFENMENEGVTLTSGTTVIAVSGGCITGGTFTSNSSDDAAIYNASGATLNLNGGYVVGTGRCNPGNGWSLFGGGICNYGTVTMSGGAVCGNSITGDSGKSYMDNLGGGIYNEGALTISAGSVCYNVASSAVNNSRYGDGGGIYNLNGTLTISGTAEISNNTADFGGGVLVYSGTFEMTGGKITGNEATQVGGGVYVNGGTFTMSGTAEISGNTAPYGGGICNYGTLKMSGTAEISGNTAQYGGGVYQCGTMTIGGTAVITGNTKLNESGEDTGNADNLLVVTGYTTVTIGTKTGDTEETKGNGVAALAEGAKIGVNIVDYNDVRTSGAITSSGATTDVPYFFSDDASYVVKYNKGQYLELAVIPDVVKNATYNASLTLDADIDLNFTMGSLGTDGKGTDFVQSKLTITVDGTEWTNYKVKDGELSGTLASVAPQNIGTDLHIVITYDGIVIKDFNYSVKAYCDAVFKAQAADKALDTPTGKYDTLADLCEALLNYGKYVADYVNKNTDSTINAGHEATFDDYTFTDVKNANTVLGKYAAEGSEAYLALGSTIKLNFLLKNCSEALVNDDPETQNFFVLNDKAEPEQIDPERVKITTKDNDTIVSVDLYASQLATSYTLKLKGVSTDKFCITYGVYNYCSAAQNQNGFSDTLKTLCKAIHNYSVAVQAYIDSTAQ